VFTSEQRDSVREYVLNLARTDPRVTSGALIGSMAGDAEDQWSDIDITFGIADGFTPTDVLDDWSEVLERELGALHYWDLPFASSIYRVYLLPSGLELDVSATPQADFGARGPRFRTLFGTSRELEPTPPPSTRYLIGLCWHHVLHARASIERDKPWRAEYWISALRDNILTLACIRLGEEPAYGRGADRLPASVTEPLAGTLVRSLDRTELRRALAVATECFLSELQTEDSVFAAHLRPVLEELGAP